MMAALMLKAVAASASWPTELPSFPHYPGRRVYSLTGSWDFAYSASYNASTTTSLAALTFNGTQPVPGAWDAGWSADARLHHARGVGAYRTTVEVPVGQPAALHFSACSLFCRVFVDGALLHNHTAGGFTPFWVPVPASTTASTRTLTVLTSNNFSHTLTPTQYDYYDFYQYGGLLRPVALHVLPRASPSIGHVEVLPLAAHPGAAPSGEVNVTVVLRPPAGRAHAAHEWVPAAYTDHGPSRVRLQLSWDGGPPGSWREYAVAAGGRVVLPAQRVPGFRVWQPPSNPTSVPKLPLHTLTVGLSAGSPATANAPHTVENRSAAARDDVDATPALGAAPKAADDAVTVRFGMRTISTSGRQILLNGQPIKLKGFNRHDMYPNLGPTLPLERYESDLTQVQLTLHANFLRGSHYPQDARLLDLCDERGILVWDEALAWGNWANVLLDPTFLAAELSTASAMLDGSINHPSIILWGFFNEGQSDNASATESYAKMAKTFRSRDASRLITWADNRMERSEALPHADVVSFNSYPGWYNGPAAGIDASWRAHAAWVAEHYPEKPFIISETGAGGLVGNHSDNATAPARWSEEYQVVVDGLDVRTALACDNISGIALWQLMDIKVDEPHNSTRRPGGINNKGVLDRWRTPKLAAGTVADAYASVP